MRKLPCNLAAILDRIHFSFREFLIISSGYFQSQADYLALVLWLVGWLVAWLVAWPVERSVGRSGRYRISTQSRACNWKRLQRSQLCPFAVRHSGRRDPNPPSPVALGK